MYVPKKSSKLQPGINNNGGEYEGIWSGPFDIPVSQIQRSHNTSQGAKPAKGYEDKPIRIQRKWDSSYRIVDGNKRLARAKAQQLSTIQAYIFEGKYEEGISSI